ncbi:hypothetical protein BG015_004019, partial [Linnemannia schmuckeri]
PPGFWLEMTMLLPTIATAPALPSTTMTSATVTTTMTVTGSSTFIRKSAAASPLRQKLTVMLLLMIVLPTVMNAL